MSDHPTPGPAGDGDDLPPEIAELLAGLTGGAPLDPEAVRMLKDMGIDKVDPRMLQMAAQQFQTMMNRPVDGPVDATFARDVARQTVSAGGDPSVGDADRRALDGAAQVAGLWLDEATDFASTGVRTHAWSRAEWVEATLPVWERVVQPVAAGVNRAIGDSMRRQIERLGDLDDPTEALAAAGLPPGLVPEGTDPRAMLGQMEPVLERMGSAMFGAQLGQAVGALAGDVVTGTEVGLPLVPDGTVVLLPSNVAAFADGLEVDLEQVRLYLAVREAARVRLFAAVPWLGPQLLTAVQDYARDITIDTDAIEAGLAGVDPTDVGALQEALQGQLFHPQPSPAQQAALRRLETYLALVEGWVDVVADRATAGRLPQAAALGETVRRRRATGGPAEKAFAGLVGLELRPRRLRDAANLFAALEDAGGADLRDGAWGHPDVAPTAADLDDPLGYVERQQGRGSEDSDASDTFDEELEALLRGETGGGAGGQKDGPGDGPGGGSGPEAPRGS